MGKCVFWRLYVVTIINTYSKYKLYYELINGKVQELRNSNLFLDYKLCWDTCKVTTCSFNTNAYPLLNVTIFRNQMCTILHDGTRWGWGEHSYLIVRVQVSIVDNIIEVGYTNWIMIENWSYGYSSNCK